MTSIEQAISELHSVDKPAEPAKPTKPAKPAKPAKAKPADEPASQNQKMHDTIRDVVSRLASDVVTNLGKLRQEIDDLEKLVIENSARVTDNLSGHADICGSVQQEIHRLHGVLADIRKTQLDAAAEMNGQPHEREN